MQKILITGASKGFGKLITDTLLKDGHTVAASMRDTNGRNKAAAEELKASGAIPIELDVINDASVEAGVEAALKEMGGIDTVINNAGVGVIGQQEAFTPEDWQNLFDINVFGVQRVNRAVLPHMRQQRNGLLMHISSLLGRVVIPFYGPYNATKFALEAMADNYRVELSPLGIESIIVEPGGFGTNFLDALWKPTDQARKQSYGPMADAPEQSIAQFEQMFIGENAPNPQMVADAISGILKMPKGQRPFRTTVDGIGMDAAIKPYNEAADQMTRTLYENMGMANLLTVNTAE